MGKFVIRRVVQAIFVVIAATMVLYLLLFVISDPFASTGEKTVPPETQEILREKFGLDKSLPMQYLTYIGNLFTGDFGVDFNQRREVSEMIAERLPATVRLAVAAITIDIVIGVVAGIIAAVWRYSFWDVLVTVIFTLAIGIPTFVIGLWLREGVSGNMFFPLVPRPATDVAPWYTEIWLPAFTLAIVDAAFIARLMRGSMLEVLRTDYIRTARAKGLGERKVIMKHAFRNSIIPVVTYVGVGIGILLGGALITEQLFQYKGVGFLMVESIRQDNNPVIMSLVALAVVIYVILSMLVDILYAYLDPRIRLN